MADVDITHNRYIVLYDGTCKLCNNVVRFISRNDKKHLFCFVPLESEKATEYSGLYARENVEKGSMLLIEDKKLFTKSDAVFRILKRLRGLWSILYIFIVLPRFIRDPVYDIIARYRYRWFGSCIDCPDPKPCN